MYKGKFIDRKNFSFGVEVSKCPLLAYSLLDKCSASNLKIDIVWQQIKLLSCLNYPLSDLFTGYQLVGTVLNMYWLLENSFHTLDFFLNLSCQETSPKL